MNKEIPILFSTPMVQAIIASRKTQTRRVVKGLADEWLTEFTPEYVADPGNFFSPYGYAGDILWVRESFARLNSIPCAGIPVKYLWRADNEFPFGDDKKIKWKPSIHMPKGAARIWLQIESIRIERLQSITEEDAKAEGSSPMPDWGNFEEKDTHYAGFEYIWLSINGSGSWKANPYVWAITFKVLSTTGRPAQLTTNNSKLSTHKSLPGVKSSSHQSLDSLGFQSGKEKGLKNGTPEQAF